MKLVPLILAASLFVGCAQRQLQSPSGTGTASAIGRTGSSVQDAKRYNDLAVIHNANARTRVERIEAKAEVIQKYWQSNEK